MVAPAVGVLSYWAASKRGFILKQERALMRNSTGAWLALTAVLSGGCLWANDVVPLQGQVKMADGSAPAREVEIQLTCGSVRSRQVMTNKSGKYFLKVERDDFNHVVKLISTTVKDFSDGTIATASCSVNATLQGYTSNSIDLGSYVIGKDLKLPE
jgi:hypothetical protein